MGRDFQNLGGRPIGLPRPKRTDLMSRLWCQRRTEVGCNSQLNLCASKMPASPPTPLLGRLRKDSPHRAETCDLASQMRCDRCIKQNCRSSRFRISRFGDATLSQEMQFEFSVLCIIFPFSNPKFWYFQNIALQLKKIDSKKAQFHFYSFNVQSFIFSKIFDFVKIERFRHVEMEKVYLSENMQKMKQHKLKYKLKCKYKVIE